MQASDLVKLAASISSGAISYEVATEHLSEDGLSALDSLLAGGAGIVGGVVGGRIVGSVMDATGISDAIDDVFSW